MYANILSFTSGRKEVMATVRVTKGKLVVKGQLSTLLYDTIKDIYTGSPTPGAFFERLPRQLSGSLVRAERIYEPTDAI